MRYEYTIGLRYLLSKRSAREPSVIALLTVAGIALAVAVHIVVLAIMGGFEADLREKILGTRAHVLVTGPQHGVLVEPERALEVLDAARDVTGAAPFIESEVMIASPTNYSGMVMRGIDRDRALVASRLADYVVEGDLAWLDEPWRALGFVQPDGFPAPFPGTSNQRINDELEELSRQAETLEAELAELRRAVRDLDGERGEEPATGAAAGSRWDDDDEDDDYWDRSDDPVVMPGLPLPAGGGDDGEDVHDDADAFGMPGLPEPGGTGQPSRGQTPRHGVFIGRELQRTLSVLVGDTVNLIVPDGDLGPTGLMPRSRPFLVVGIFYTGYFEYDNAMGMVSLDAARALLDWPHDEVSGIEIRTRSINHADEAAVRIEAQLEAAGVTDVEVRDWRVLNRSLFAALQLEKVAVGAVIGIMIVVSCLLVLIVIFMIVIEKRREIAVLKAIGASRTTIARIFLTQGVVMGGVGSAVGLVLGMGIVAYLVYVGYPLPPEVYYIDRVPVEVHAIEVVSVVLIALTSSIAMTVIPAWLAAREDPVSGLRED